MTRRRNEIDRQLRFANLMEKAQVAYQVKKLDRATFELYHNALDKYSIEAIEARLDRHIETSEFFPKVSDLVPMGQHGTHLADQYVAPPKMSRGARLANQVLLNLVLTAGGVTPEKLRELVFVKNAEAHDFDEQREKDPDYRQQFVRQVEAQLRDQLTV